MTDYSVMLKRIVAASLWFVSVWLMYGLVAYFVGLSDRGGAVLGVLVAALIWLDPTGAFWRVPDTRTADRHGRLRPDAAPEIAR